MWPLANLKLNNIYINCYSNMCRSKVGQSSEPIKWLVDVRIKTRTCYL